jgi:hypothetical protein
MAKGKKKVEDVNVDTPVVSEESIIAESEAEVLSGKYDVKKVEGGYVVLDKAGKVISNVLNQNKAIKTADSMNRINK